MAEPIELPSPLYSGATGAAPTKRATRSTVRLSPDTRQLAGLFKALKKMDKESNDKLRDDVTAISMWSANQIKMGAFGYGVQMGGQAARLLAVQKLDSAAALFQVWSLWVMNGVLTIHFLMVGDAFQLELIRAETGYFLLCATFSQM